MSHCPNWGDNSRLGARLWVVICANEYWDVLVNINPFSSVSKVAWFGGLGIYSDIIYLKSAGLFTPGVEILTYSVQPLLRYHNRQAAK